MTTGPRLTVELVPRMFWQDSLHKTLPRAQWNRCRDWALARTGGRCAACGALGPGLNCDEMWSYAQTGELWTRRLTGLRMLCRDCHAVKHAGRTLWVLGAGRGRQVIVEQLATVNGWTSAEAKKCVREAFTLWRERNTYVWDDATDYTWLRETLGIVPTTRRTPLDQG